MKKVQVPGIVENSSKKFTEGEIDYKYTSDEEVNGFGRFVSKDVALTVIKAHRDHLKLKNEKDQPFAMTFGKEALLSILAQKGCEGVRFYFGKRDKDQWEPGSPYANRVGITLVAIGVDADNKDIGIVEGNLMDALDNTQSLLTLKDGLELPRIVEVVPPLP